MVKRPRRIVNDHPAKAAILRRHCVEPGKKLVDDVYRAHIHRGDCENACRPFCGRRQSERLPRLPRNVLDHELGAIAGDDRMPEQIR